METPLPEVHPSGDLCLDLSGPVEPQHLRKDDVGEYEGPLEVPCPPEYPLPFRSQDGREPTPYCAKLCGVPAS